MKISIIIYLLVYIIAYIFIQRKFDFKNVFVQLFVAIGLFLAFEFGYTAIKWSKHAILNDLPVPGAVVTHYELDSVMPSVLSPLDTGFSEQMGENKNHFERKVDYIPQYSLDSPTSTTLICCYGGSSTYCVGLRSDSSWPSLLQKKLTDQGYHVLVHNHGIAGHNIKDAYTELTHYPCPDIKRYRQHIQLHYHGWNDLRMIHLPFISNDDSTYTKSSEWHVETNKLMTGLMPVKPAYDAYNFLYFRQQDAAPSETLSAIMDKTFLLKLVYKKLVTYKMNQYIKQYSKDMLMVKDSSGKEAQHNRELFMAYFSKYVNAINQLQQPGEQLLFIPQVLNYPMLDTAKKETFSYWMPGISEQFACLITKDIRRYLTGYYPQNATLYSDVQSGWAFEDFLDNGHFSGVGNIKFVNKITPSVLALINNKKQ